MSQHRKLFHTDPDNYMVFFKTKEKFYKNAAGSTFNFFSRVLSGVIAGIIMATLAPHLAPTLSTPSSGAAIVGGSVN